MPSIKMNTLFVFGLLLLSACNKQQFVVPEESKSFEQAVTYNNKVDIVLMVDNSSSMDIYQNKLANQVPEMLSALDQVGMDYQIVVVTTDMRSTGNGGKFVGTPRVLTNGSANLAAALTARVKQGTGGSDLERGLLSIKTALSPAYLNSAGRGFLRNDALLAVIALSNEDDRSDGDLQDYKTFFEQLKPNMKTAFGDTRSWMVNFIGVPSLQSSCSTSLDGAYKEAGLRWIELANYTGGVVEPICDSSLAQSVVNIRQRIVQVLTDFHLGRAPQPATLAVKINGNVVPESKENGWEYIADGYIIRFHGNAVPAATDKIAVDYQPASAL